MDVPEPSIVSSRSLWRRPSKFQPLALALLLAYGLLAVWMGVFLKFEFIQSDVLGYWRASLSLGSLFQRFHLPLYPLTIAVFRLLTFGWLPPLALMMGINIMAYLAGLALVYRILITSGVEEGLALVGVAAYGLWPFTGLVHAIFPLADVPATTLFLAGLYACQRSHFKRSALFFGLALITHKALWLYAVALAVVFLLRGLRSLGEVVQQNRAALALLVAPLVLIWLLGISFRSSLTWIWDSNFQWYFATLKTFRFFNGILATALEGGARGWIKGGALLLVTLLSAILLFLSLRRRSALPAPAIAISAAVLILTALIYKEQAWAVMRFSKLLALPLIWSLASFPRRLPPGRLWKWAGWAGLAALALSQVGYAWYMAAIYYQ